MLVKCPLFITLEGGEGTGKSTLIEKLKDSLTAQGYDVVATREPGGTRLGEAVRELLLHHNEGVRIGNYAELMLFLAARTQHIEELIEPSLRLGKIVLCDRFNDSTVAYQGSARGLGIDVVQKQCELACHGVLPDLTLYLDVDPDIGLQRTRGVKKDSAELGSVDRIESEEILFHQKVREGMLKIAQDDPKRIYTIDASASLDEVFGAALEVVLEAVQRKLAGADV